MCVLTRVLYYNKPSPKLERRQSAAPLGLEGLREKIKKENLRGRGRAMIGQLSRHCKLKDHELQARKPMY